MKCFFKTTTIRKLPLLIFFSFLTHPLLSQVKLIVRVDSLLIPGGDLYLSSDLNDWSPKDDNFKLRAINDSTYYIQLENLPERLEYKFTQGSWDHVEGNHDGTSRSNRVLEKDVVGPESRVAIDGWENKLAYVIHFIEVPENTPHDATIFLTGNFNNWNENDKSYQAKRLPDGTYRVTVFTSLDKIEFKVHRGNWESVEGKKNGRSIPNHILTKNQLQPGKNIELKIESWEDLQSTFNFYSLFDIFLLFSAFQGLLLSITIPSIQDFNRKANKWLIYLLLIASSLTFFRVIGNFREVANIFPKLVLLPNFIFFAFAPTFYLYVRKLLFEETIHVNDHGRHFIPLLIMALAYLPFFMLDGKVFQYKVVNEESDLVFLYIVTWVIGLFYNLYYLYRSRRVIDQYEEKYIHETAHHQDIQYLKTATFFELIALIVATLAAALFVMRYFYHIVYDDVVENCINMAWLVFSFIGYLLGYYAINQPEIFKVMEKKANDSVPVFSFENKTDELDSLPENAEEDFELEPALLELKESLLDYFAEKKPYLNNNLSISDLANHFDVPIASISKVINNGFQKNFFDFVNTYRVNEFKEQLMNPKNKNYTLLGIAYGAGFNSKTSFNRAFKKITNQTPSEFYQDLQIN